MRQSPTFSARLDRTDKQRLADLARRLNCTQVDALRLAIRAGLSEPASLTALPHSVTPQAQA